MKPRVAEREILRFANGHIESAEDVIVTEFPVTDSKN